MEDGADTNDLFDEVEKRHHEAEHGGHGEPGTHGATGEHPSAASQEKGAKGALFRRMRGAVMASILAIAAAITLLYSGHSESEAILTQAKASDQWSYYQAKSVKKHLAESNIVLLQALTPEGSPQSARVAERVTALHHDADQYTAEMDKISKEAKILEDESKAQLERHEQLSHAGVCFQIGIVLASVSLMLSGMAAAAPMIRWLGEGLFYSCVGLGLIGALIAALAVF